MLFEAKVNDSPAIAIKVESDGIKIGNNLVAFDAISTGDRRLHLLVENRSLQVELLGFDENKNAYHLKINNYLYQIKIKDELQIMLTKLGFDTISTKKINEVRAPMPGLVMRLLVKEGSAFVKGDGLIVLESMKMENVLKAPTDGVVGEIRCKEGQAVEKNDILIKVV